MARHGWRDKSAVTKHLWRLDRWEFNKIKHSVSVPRELFDRSKIQAKSGRIYFTLRIIYKYKFLIAGY